MNTPTFKHALVSARVAARANDRAGFVVAVRVVQSRLYRRLDLVRVLDEAIQAFPHDEHLRTVEAALFEGEDAAAKA